MILKSKSPISEWWKTIFDERYLKTYVDATPPKATAQQVPFLLKALHLEKGAKILDLACGYGRHAIPLAKRGYQVTGLDFSRHFIELARSEAAKQGLKSSFLHGDMRKFSFQGEFDAIINIFSAFGYFEGESDDALVLRNISRALKSKGRLLMDLNNTLGTLIRAAQQGTTDRKTGRLTNIRKEKLSNGFTVKEKNEFLPETMHWVTTKSWKEKGQKHGYQFKVRAFILPELKRLMEQNGLRVERLWGGFDGSPFRFDSRRLIILARKA